MTRIFLILVSACLIISACNNNKTTVTETDKDTVTKKSDLPSGDNTGDAEKIKEELDKMTPFTPEQMEKLVPDDLSGYSRTQLSSNTNLGTAMVSATYKTGDDKELMLTVLDCGGPAGAGVYDVLYGNVLNHDNSDADEYSKTIDLNGGKVIEHGNKGSGYSSLTWFTDKRFLVSVEGDDLEVLKQATKSVILQ